MLEDDVVDTMIKDYGDELDALAEEGRIWLEDFMTYRNSARGIVDVLQVFTNSIADNMGQSLEMLKNDVDVQAALDIADQYGMNNAG